MPRCSIVIPVHGRSSVTRQCLETLFAATPEISAEIIVVDDGSTDHTARMLDRYGDRIRVLTRETNGGFAAACNDGARIAAGEYVVFLNNDTIPRPGWLDALVRTADADRRVTVVGAKLVTPIETIQHAGVVICQDRYPRNLYAGFPADHPAVNRSRGFRIVTGAAMLVRRAAFHEVNGFDEGYVNAYEDCDLCLRLGERGHLVRYCHEAVLVHLEGATRAARVAEQEHATHRFRLRWASRLEPDDLDYYVADGLLRVGYRDKYPLEITLSPLLGTLEENVRGAEIERLLARRSRQVHELLRREAEREEPTPEGGMLEAEGRGAADDLPRPPQELAAWVGPANFREVGEEYVSYLVELAGLRPTDRVLDVGCGVGRMALPLTRVLQDGGTYDGFDVMEAPIRWCREHVSPRFPHFRFQHVDVRNGFYSPAGAAAATEIRYPYEDASFDLVLLASVFTHLIPTERDHYLAEIARVLRPGGKCLASFFLLNEESLALIRAGLSPGLPFPHRREGHRLNDAVHPEAAVAHDEAFVLRSYRDRRLTLDPSIRYGTWCGRLDGLSYQDIVVATRS